MHQTIFFCPLVCKRTESVWMPRKYSNSSVLILRLLSDYWPLCNTMNAIESGEKKTVWIVKFHNRQMNRDPITPFAIEQSIDSKWHPITSSRFGESIRIYYFVSVTAPADKWSHLFLVSNLSSVINLCLFCYFSIRVEIKKSHTFIQTKMENQMNVRLRNNVEVDPIENRSSRNLISSLASILLTVCYSSQFEIYRKIGIRLRLRAIEIQTLHVAFLFDKSLYSN